MTGESKHKKALAEYRRFCNEIAAATSVPHNESKDDRARRIKRARKDYNFFVRYYFPNMAQSDCAKFHIEAANKVLKNPMYQGIWEWARGLAKSTHANIFIPIWLMIQEPPEISVMVLVGKNQNDAIKKLSNIQAQFTSNNRLIHDYGEKHQFGTWEDGSFVTSDNIAFFALGRGQSPRGTNNQAIRPDYITTDDIEDDELVRNPKRVEEIMNWELQALFPAMYKDRARYIKVNNRIGLDTVLTRFVDKFKKSKYWHYSRVNALDSKGRPSWPENYSKDHYERIKERDYISFEQEYMNNPMRKGKIFKKEWIRFTKIKPLNQYSAIISYTDPSFKDTKFSDFKATVEVGLLQSGNTYEFHIIDVFNRQCTVLEMISYQFERYNQYAHQGISLSMYLEANMLQDYLFKDYNEEGAKRWQFLPIVPDTRKKPQKFSRILSIAPFFQRGVVYFNEKIKDNTDCESAIDHLLAFEEGSGAPDDWPDAVEGALFLLNRQKSIGVGDIIVGKRKSLKSAL